MLDFTFVGKALGKLIERVPYSMMIVLISILVSTVMAILLTMVRIKKIKVLNGLVGIYLSFFRSTPGLIHILLIYYGLPLLLKPLGIVMNASGKGFYSIAALSFYSAANLTEIFRPAYLAIDKGQHEAALCVGLSGFQKEIRIILPAGTADCTACHGKCFY